MFASIVYASPSAFRSTRDHAELDVAASVTRPVRFCGRVVHNGFALRIALRALGEAIWSSDYWASEGDFRAWTLDPVITVHPDRVWFEAFSQDMSAYCALIVDPANFDIESTPTYGTTNIDFTAWLWGAIGEMRSSRNTRITIGAEGFEVTTQGAGGRFQEKVELPDHWVRGFLQVQAAMSLPGTRLSLRPVDLLAAIRFLKFNKAKISPRALRYEMEPGRDARLVIEPWDHAVPLEGASHGYTERRVIRTWGRRRLKLIESLLPFADRVDVYLKGRAMPSFYAVRLPGMTFLLGLSGFSSAGFGESGGLGLSLPARPSPNSDRLLPILAQRFRLTTADAASAAGCTEAEAAQALTALCVGGRVMYDVEAREWRHRELFNPPVDTAHLFPPDSRREEADRLATSVVVEAARPEEQRKTRRYKDPVDGRMLERELVFRQWRLRGAVSNDTTEIVVNAEERIIFGQCTCAWFKDNLMAKGPCPHMLALYDATATTRSSAPLDTPQP